MNNFVKIDGARRRVVIRAQGQWTLAQAHLYHDDMLDVLHWAMGTGTPITIFADLTGLILHTTDVSKRIEEAVLLMRRFPIDRYALIVPSYLMRMQCRRLLAGIDHVYFEDEVAARTWLGWEGSRSAAA